MLQDRHAVDVNMLLFACWAAGWERGVLSCAEIDAAIDATSSLQQDTVRPLRAERRAIPKDSEHAEERRRLLDLELAAEKAELDLLESLWETDAPPLTGAAVIDAAARANMRLYLAHRGIDLSETARTALDLMAHAAADIHMGMAQSP